MFIFLNLLKGSLFAFGVWVANCNNGFSGLQTVKEFYFALAPVTMTTATVAAMAAFDQYLPFNEEKYKRDSTQKKSHLSKDYNPVSSQPISINSIFNRDEWIEKNGISKNSDGSTNNVTDYFQYVRGSWIKNFKWLWLANLVCGPLGGLVLYYGGTYTFSGIINVDGQVNDYWNASLAPYGALLLSHFFLIWTETRNHTLLTSAWYLGSGFCLYLTIRWSDNLKSSTYYGNQWSMAYQSPLIYLSVFL
jgi:hypothetical protein